MLVMPAAAAFGSHPSSGSAMASTEIGPILFTIDSATATSST